MSVTSLGVLAPGAHRMAGRGAIARRLEPEETFGSTSVLSTDPTGPATVDGQGDDPAGTVTPNLREVRGLADSPEPVLPSCQGVTASVSAAVEAGPRVLAAARGRAPRPGQRPEQVEAALDLLGVLALQDPSRKSAAVQVAVPLLGGTLPDTTGWLLAEAVVAAPPAADAADKALRGKR